MINEEMKADIMTFEVPLLVLGDPGQLPPIDGTGALVNGTPDVMLTEIHRQALDNPIIKLSVKARQGESIPYGEYGTSKRITIDKMTRDLVRNADQILTGKNKTRIALNRKYRTMLEFQDLYPMKGDKLICLRNNKILGIFNGLLCTVIEKLEEYDIYITYKLLTEDGKEIIVDILKIYFDEYKFPGVVKNAKWWDLQDAQAFDYGYAITVHKSQGSQWDNVILYDDGFMKWDLLNRMRWLYTGITRAAETITIVA